MSPYSPYFTTCRLWKSLPGCYFSCLIIWTNNRPVQDCTQSCFRRAASNEVRRTVYNETCIIWTIGIGPKYSFTWSWPGKSMHHNGHDLLDNCKKLGILLEGLSIIILCKILFAKLFRVLTVTHNMINITVTVMAAVWYKHKKVAMQRYGTILCSFNRQPYQSNGKPYISFVLLSLSFSWF